MPPLMQPFSIHTLPAPLTGKTGWPWTEPGRCPDEPDASTSLNGNNGRESELWPTITIITPSFNQGEFIEETIRSVLLQRYPNLEYIIIDGGSTDNSKQVITKYAQWLTFWVSEPDRGQSHAINKGLKRATGEIVAWLNSDDLYEPGALLKVGALYRANRDKIIAGRIIDFDNDSGKETVTRQYNISFETIVKFWEGNHWWHQPGMFFPTESVKKAGYLREDLHYGMDYDLLCRLTRICETICVEDVFARFRLHDRSKTVGTRDRSMYESSLISKQYWPLLGLAQTDAPNAHDRTVTMWFVKRANYFGKRFRLRRCFTSLSLSLSVSKKYTCLAIIKEMVRMSKGGRFTGRT